LAATPNAARIGVRARLARTLPGYNLSTGRVLAIYLALMAAIFLAALDQTIVATAGPRIATDLRGFGGYAGMFAAYMLASTVTIPLYGRLGDVHGRRPMLVIAVSLFLVGSALCAAAQGMTELVLARAVQGLGAGGLFPLSLAVIASIVPPRDRGKWHGLINSVWAAASILGPALGGLIVDNVSWRWIFLLNLPLAGGALAVILVAVPRRTRRVEERSVDWTGAALLAGLTATLLLLAGSLEDGWTSRAVLLEGAVSVVALVLFVLAVRRAPDPILPFAALRDPLIAGSIACTFLGGMLLYGVLSYVPLFVQGVIGTSATSSGVVLTPLLLGAVVTSFVTGQLITRTGRYRGNVLFGPAALCAGCAMLWLLDVQSTNADAARAMVVVGVGMGSVFQVFMLTVQNVAKRDQIGTLTAFAFFSRHMGATLAVAAMGVIVGWRLPEGVLDEHQTVRRLPLEVRTSLAEALQPAFLVTAIAAFALWIVAIRWVKATPLRRSVDAVPADPATSA
jgi:EmrB/QacA subfamily drug resistance transporter